MTDSEPETSSLHSDESRCEDEPVDPSQQLPHVIEVPPCDEALNGDLPPLPSAATQVKVTNSQHIRIGNNYHIQTPQVNFIVAHKDMMEIKSVGGNENGEQNGLLSVLFNRCFPCTQGNERNGENQTAAIEAEPARSLDITSGEAENATDVKNAIETLLPEGVKLNGTVENAIETLLPEGVKLNGTVDIPRTSLRADWDPGKSNGNIPTYSIFRCCFSNTAREREIISNNGTVETFPMQQLQSERTSLPDEGRENGAVDTNGEENATNSQALRLGVAFSMILVFSIVCTLIAVFIANGETDGSNRGQTDFEFTTDNSTVSVTWPTPTDVVNETKLAPLMDETPELDRVFDWQFFGLLDDAEDLYRRVFNITSTARPLPTSSGLMDETNASGWTDETNTSAWPHDTNTTDGEGGNSTYTTTYLLTTVTVDKPHGTSTTTSVPSNTTQDEDENTNYTISAIDTRGGPITEDEGNATSITKSVPNNTTGYTDNINAIQDEDENTIYTTSVADNSGRPITEDEGKATSTTTSVSTINSGRKMTVNEGNTTSTFQYVPTSVKNEQS